MKLIPSRALIVVGAALALGIGGGLAVAAIPSSDGTITACMVKPGGTIRLINAEAGEACKKGEQLLTWNQQGQPGTNGTNGTNGANGVSGYEIVSDQAERTISSNTTKALIESVACPAGKKIVGGGGAGTLINIPTNSAVEPLDLIGLSPDEFQGQSSMNASLAKLDGSFFTTDESGFITVYGICVTALP
jgi:hypothetical protein